MRSALRGWFPWRSGARARPYRVADGPLSRAEIIANCKAASADLTGLGLTTAFASYVRLTDHLRRSSRIRVLRLARLHEESAQDRVLVGLRHDVDDDVWTALRCARRLASIGMPGSFYLLHTSHYYGRFTDRRFLRHRGLTSILRELLVAGCEVGLHNDALGVYYRFGFDGLQAVQTELDWLRQQGLQVLGTTAHNSAPVHGAENFEVFRGLAFADRGECVRDGRTVPLQGLVPQALGLMYEGNFPRPRPGADPAVLERFLAPPAPDAIRSRQWLESYFCRNPTFDRDYDASVWLLAADAWMIATHGQQPTLLWPVDLDRVLEFLDRCAPDSRVIFNIHPEYLFEPGY